MLLLLPLLLLKHVLLFVACWHELARGWVLAVHNPT
jgi:hypothetical protein